MKLKGPCGFSNQGLLFQFLAQHYTLPILLVEDCVFLLDYVRDCRKKLTSRSLIMLRVRLSSCRRFILQS